MSRWKELSIPYTTEMRPVVTKTPKEVVEEVAKLDGLVNTFSEEYTSYIDVANRQCFNRIGLKLVLTPIDKEGGM